MTHKRSIFTQQMIVRLTMERDQSVDVRQDSRFDMNFLSSLFCEISFFRAVFCVKLFNDK